MTDADTLSRTAAAAGYRVAVEKREHDWVVVLEELARPGYRHALATGTTEAVALQNALTATIVPEPPGRPPFQNA